MFIREREKLGHTPGWVAEKAGFPIAEDLLIEKGERKFNNAEWTRIEQAIFGYADFLKPPYHRLREELYWWIRGNTYRLKVFLDEFYIKSRVISAIIEWVLVIIGFILYFVFIRPWALKLSVGSENYLTGVSFRCSGGYIYWKRSKSGKFLRKIWYML